jgi:hypothetical protein
MAEDTRNRPEYSSDSHASKPARDPAGDPLAELARLIGQSDPFNDISRRSAARKPLDTFKADDRPAPEWLARPAAAHERDDDFEGQHAASHTSYAAPMPPADHHDAAAHPPAEDYRPQAAGDFAHNAQYPHDRRTEQNFAAHDPHADAYQADDRYRVALPSSEYEGDSYYAEDGHMPPQGDEGPIANKRRGGIVTIAAVLGLAVIGTAGAFGYRAYTSGSGSSSSPPVIKADTTPAKTVPPAPAPAPATDSQGKPFQDRVAGADAATRTAPREEQPVSLPVAPPQRAAAPLPSPTAPQPSVQSASPLVPPMPAPTAMSEPKRVKTIPIRPDSNAADPGPTSSTPVAAPPRAPSAKQSSGASPMPIGQQSDPSARTKVATRTPAPAAPARGGSYVVQVSAQKSETEAQSSYRALQAKYPSVLSGREPTISRAELGASGTWYRVQVGAFATSEQATAFCDNLKAAGGQCIVQRN